MIEPNIRRSQFCNCLLLASVSLFSVFLWAPEVRAAEPTRHGVPAKGETYSLSQDYSREITRKGKVVVVSRMLADKIRADYSIVTAAVTVKASLDKRGKGNGYKIVAVDKGSLPQKLGILKNDIVQEVNGFKLVSTDDVNQAQDRFKDATDLNVKIIRKGRVSILYYAVR